MRFFLCCDIETNFIPLSFSLAQYFIAIVIIIVTIRYWGEAMATKTKNRDGSCYQPEEFLPAKAFFPTLEAPMAEIDSTIC